MPCAQALSGSCTRPKDWFRKVTSWRVRGARLRVAGQLDEPLRRTPAIAGRCVHRSAGCHRGSQPHRWSPRKWHRPRRWRYRCRRQRRHDGDGNRGRLQANQVKSYASSTNSHSDSLGDVQRLRNGNTLIVFSNDGLMEEVGSSWSVVQTLQASSFGYAYRRETLYRPPPR